MGTEIRLYVGDPLEPGLADPELAAIEAEAELRDFDARLSRFKDDSELTRLNQSPEEWFSASALLREAVRAGLWGAERSGGLVDPTLLEELAGAGYAESREGIPSAPLAEALAEAPPRRPARPRTVARWRFFEVRDPEAMIRRPPGTMFDSGGTGKGLAADRIARRFQGYGRFAIDCGGDVRVGGRDPGSEVVRVEIRNPLKQTPAEVLEIARGAVATSGIDVHLWRSSAPGYGHHLIDPASGEPAWSGLICATARAPSALEADVLAKAALLGGGERAGEFLGEHGGLIIHEDGVIERFGPLLDPPRFRLSGPGRHA